MEPNGKRKKNRQDNKDGTRARSTAAPAQAIIFPKLTFLSLKGLDFEYPSNILLNVFKKGLRQRKAARKAPLRMLRIDDCVIRASRAKTLQKLVREFHWDGEQCCRDDFESDSDSDSD
jgi:hypothetical protein